MFFTEEEDKAEMKKNEEIHLRLDTLSVNSRKEWKEV